jgi:hypothetical protein
VPRARAVEEELDKLNAQNSICVFHKLTHQIGNGMENCSASSAARLSRELCAPSQPTQVITKRGALESKFNKTIVRPSSLPVSQGTGESACRLPRVTSSLAGL